MLNVATDLRRTSATAIVGLVLLTAAAVILAALGFEHIGGYEPCPLCLQQRYAYYGAIPALAAALISMRFHRPKVAVAILALVAVAFVVNAGLGIYQAGAEWKFWDPPATCAAPASLSTFDINQLNFDRVPAGCGVASWRLLGLSFAGWNAVASIVLAAGALAAAFRVSPRLP